MIAPDIGSIIGVHAVTQLLPCLDLPDSDYCITIMDDVNEDDRWTDKDLVPTRLLIKTGRSCKITDSNKRWINFPTSQDGDRFQKRGDPEHQVRTWGLWLFELN